MRDTLALLHKVLIPYGLNAGYSTAVTNTVNRSVSTLLYKRQNNNGINNSQSSSSSCAIGDSLDTSSSSSLSSSSSSSAATGSYSIANSTTSLNTSTLPPPNNMANVTTTGSTDESSKKSTSPYSSRFGGLGSRSDSLSVAGTGSGSASVRGSNINTSSSGGISTNDNNSLNDSRSDIISSNNKNNGGNVSVTSMLEASFLDRVDRSRQQWSRVEETGWVDHLRVLLDSSVLVAETMLVHCSDGWDRTAQVINELFYIENEICINIKVIVFIES